MPENKPQTDSYPDFALEFLERFCNDPRGIERRSEYIQRGLIPTNNLWTYFRTVAQRQFMLGMREVQNPFYYQNRPFGPALDELRRAQPELWKLASGVADAVEPALLEAMIRYDSALADVKADQLMERLSDEETVFWAKTAVFDEVFRALKPHLEASGIEPIDVCI